jgi:hypothetical protein
MNTSSDTSNQLHRCVPANDAIAVRDFGPGSTTSGSKVTVSTAQKPSRLWLWFVAAFVVQATAWTIWFTIAAQHRIQEVPLATQRSDR